MDDRFKNIKAVGFDMDGTLYTYIPEIGQRIAQKSAEVVLDLKPELETIEAAKEYFINESKAKESRYKAMLSAGHPKPKLAMRKVLEEVNTEDLVVEDKHVAELVKRISKSKYTYLVTTSPSTVAPKVLAKIGINEDWFNRTVYGDDELINGLPKANAMKDIIENLGFGADGHVYIGDRQQSDIIEPKELGMMTIAVGAEFPEADAVVDNVLEVESLLL